MFYRTDKLEENKINPVTGQEYDSSWIILMLTNSKEYSQMCGSSNGCAYTIKISRSQYKDWKMAVGDFIGFNQYNGKNILLVTSETDFQIAMDFYKGHKYNEPFLRENEPDVLVHSTTMSSWELIKQDGMLKSWNKLKARKSIEEEEPIGIKLGDRQILVII